MDRVYEMAWVRQGVEGSNCQPIVNTVNGKIGAFTVSGQLIAASASSFPLKVALVAWTDDGTARQYVSDISVTASATWQSFEVTIPADATGSFANDNGSGMRIGFGLYGGSNRQATNNTWANYAGHCATSATHNWAAAEDEYIGFTRFKCEPGEVATANIEPDYASTLEKCLRYYERITGDVSSQIVGVGVCRSTTSCSQIPFHYAVKRAVPTLTVNSVSAYDIISSSAGGVATSNLTAQQLSTRSVAFAATVASGLTDGRPGALDMDADEFFEISAEL